MKVFIINLRRSEGRRMRMEKALAGLSLDYEFFEGVDGYELSEDVLESYIDPRNEYHRTFKPGEVGCFLSHYNVYRKIVEDRLPYALILEDDIEASKRLPGLLEDIEKLIKQGDVLHLYSSFPTLCHLTSDSKINKDYWFVKPAEDQLVVGNVAYIITLSVAEKMIHSLLPMDNVIDDWRYWLRKGYVKDFKIVFPHPIDLSDNYSDIHESYGGLLLKLKKYLVNNSSAFANYVLRKRKMQRLAGRVENIRIDGRPPEKIFY